jgi:hypothetical protein
MVGQNGLSTNNRNTAGPSRSLERNCSQHGFSSLSYCRHSRSSVGALNRNCRLSSEWDTRVTTRARLWTVRRRREIAAETVRLLALSLSSPPMKLGYHYAEVVRRFDVKEFDRVRRGRNLVRRDDGAKRASIGSPEN